MTIYWNYVISHLSIVSTHTLIKASLASARLVFRVRSTAILASSPTMHCWSALWITSWRLAVVGMQRVCTLILLSPWDETCEVYLQIIPSITLLLV